MYVLHNIDMVLSVYGTNILNSYKEVQLQDFLS